MAKLRWQMYQKISASSLPSRSSTRSSRCTAMCPAHCVRWARRSNTTTQSLRPPSHYTLASQSRDEARNSMAAQLNRQPLELLDLSKCQTVSDIVDGMSRCAFGARMLGEVAATLTQWCFETKKPALIYDGLPTSPLGNLLTKQLVGRAKF